MHAVVSHYLSAILFRVIFVILKQAWRFFYDSLGDSYPGNDVFKFHYIIMNKQTQRFCCVLKITVLFSLTCCFSRFIMLLLLICALIFIMYRVIKQKKATRYSEFISIQFLFKIIIYS